MNSYKFMKLQILWFRILSVKLWIGILAWVAILTIFSIEFYLIKLPAYNQFTYAFGVIALKLSYSYFSAFIFYLLIVHFPKEKRKAKSFRLLYNSFSFLNMNIHILISAIFKNFTTDINNINQDKFLHYCSLLKENELILVGNVNLQINNHTIPTIEYVYFVINQTKSSLKEILPLSEVIDTEILEILTHIQNELNSHFNSQARSFNVIGYGLFSLFEELQHLSNRYRLTSKRHKKEHSYFTRKQTTERLKREKLLEEKTK